MTSWSVEFAQALEALKTVAELAGCENADSIFDEEYLTSPHEPTALPPGKMALYGFWGDGEWLKIGMAGPNAGPRFQSHHYHLSSSSSLAKSLRADPNMRMSKQFDPEEPGRWIMSSTHRVNVLLPSSLPRELLALAEAFLIARLRPRYEQRRAA